MREAKHPISPYPPPERCSADLGDFRPRDRHKATNRITALLLGVRKLDHDSI